MGEPNQEMICAIRDGDVLRAAEILQSLGTYGGSRALLACARTIAQHIQDGIGITELKNTMGPGFAVLETKADLNGMPIDAQELCDIDPDARDFLRGMQFLSAFINDDPDQQDALAASDPSGGTNLCVVLSGLLRDVYTGRCGGDT